MLKRLITSFTVLSFLLLPMLTPVFAADEPPATSATKNIVCKQLNETGEVKCDDASAENSLQNTINNVVNILTFIIGTAAVIIIIIAGLLFVFGGGNPKSPRRAKDAIIYAVVGLVVAILAR